MNDPDQRAFIDRLQVELEGQELMFDEHEWMTLIICIKRALDSANENK